jgi:hypothetical protein
LAFLSSFTTAVELASFTTPAIQRKLDALKRYALLKNFSVRRTEEGQLWSAKARPFPYRRLWVRAAVLRNFFNPPVGSSKRAVEA